MLRSTYTFTRVTTDEHGRWLNRQTTSFDHCVAHDLNEAYYILNTRMVGGNYSSIITDINSQGVDVRKVR